LLQTLSVNSSCKAELIFRSHRPRFSMCEHYSW
jgi:hypothetical protein